MTREVARTSGCSQRSHGLGTSSIWKEVQVSSKAYALVGFNVEAKEHRRPMGREQDNIAFPKMEPHGYFRTKEMAKSAAQSDKVKTRRRSDSGSLGFGLVMSLTPALDLHQSQGLRLFSGLRIDLFFSTNHGARATIREMRVETCCCCVSAATEGRYIRLSNGECGKQMRRYCVVAA
jgi:hypothetical protein